MVRLTSWAFFNWILLGHFLHTTPLLVGWSKTRKTPTHIKSEQIKATPTTPTKDTSYNTDKHTQKLYAYHSSIFLTPKTHLRNSTRSLSLSPSFAISLSLSRIFSGHQRERSRPTCPTSRSPNRRNWCGVREGKERAKNKEKYIIK